MGREEVRKPPHLAVSLDAKRNASLAAKAVGVEPGAIIWGLLEVWEHVWRTKTDVVGELILDGCFGPNPRIRQALEAYGFIAHLDDGWRVRGAEAWLFGAVERGSKGGQKTASGGKSLRNLKQFRTEADSEANTEAVPKQSRSSPEATTEALPKPSQQPTANTQQLTPPPPTKTGEPLAVVVDEEVPWADACGVPTTRIVQRIHWQESADGCWEFMQLLRELRGWGREVSRPAKFNAWFARALRETDAETIEYVYGGYLGDPKIDAHNWPTTVFIGRDGGGGIWDARKLRSVG